MAKSRSFGGIVSSLLILGAIGGGVWYFYEQKTDKEPEFAVTKVARGDITQSVTATGDLQPVVSVDVSSQISGQVKEVFVDFNSPVKAGDVLARLDPSTYEQRLSQAQAQLSNTAANFALVKLNVERTRSLREKNLVSQQELDQSEAQFAQSAAQLEIQKAAVETARVDLSRCTIYAPIDGMVLNRVTDKGRTVSASTSAPTLFTLVNDLSKMQINAAVAEADIGLIAEGQDVTFTVDAFPNRNFRGSVRQVRNAATTSSSVVSYATIIDVTNEDLRLKPGMTANVSIIVAQKTGVLRVANSALRVRLPQELLPKTPPVAAAAPAGDKAAAPGATSAAPAGATMTDDEKRRAVFTIMTEAGYQMGTPPTPEIAEKAKKLAQEKGIDPDAVTQALARMASRGQGGGNRGGAPGAGGGRRGGGGAGGQNDRGFNNTIITRTVFKLADPAAKVKKIETLTSRLGISDGFYTEVIDGLTEGDTLITSVTMPGAPAPITQAPGGGGAQNPFQGGGGRGMGGGGPGGGGGRGR